MLYPLMVTRGEQKNLRNQIEIKLKNRLTEPISSVLIFVLYNSRFQFRFRVIKYKNRGFG